MSRRPLFRALLLIVCITGFLALGYVVRQEMTTSAWQAQALSTLVKDLGYSVKPGPSDLIRFPHYGPFDERLGYVGLPEFIARLQKQDFIVTAQSRVSARQAQLADMGLYSIYHEKQRAGLRIVDDKQQLLTESIFPTQWYPAFSEIPPLVLNTLLFIENRKLLDAQSLQRNPAIEWERFGKASLDVLKKALGVDMNAAGGSTLATQLEKYQHSPGGITPTLFEKLRQMGSASLRAYLDGANTLPTRQQIARNYLNTVPLAAATGYGEVQGIGEGMRIWYQADFATANRLLQPAAFAPDQPVTLEQGKAYRQFLSLLLAQRRPTYLLGHGHDKLQRLTDSHLRLLAAEGVISAELRDSALAVALTLNRAGAPPLPDNFAEHKMQTMVRARLASNLGVKNLYELDRLDLKVTTSLHQDAQKAVTAALRGLQDTQTAMRTGLMDKRLLSKGNQLDKIIYSLMLYERTPLGNQLRVQTDNYDQPLDINEGIRLDLGSTAKLRTTVLYLQLMDELYQRYASRPRADLKKLTFHPRDHLSQWVVTQLIGRPKLTLAELLDAALAKPYSASSGENFFTGGGLHHFNNFNKHDNAKWLTVRAALRDSVNLVFIRLMRDIEYYYLYRPEGIYTRIEQGGEPLRREYLERFADEEGKVYLRRFYAKYQGKPAEELLGVLTQSVYPNPARLATVFRSIRPELPPEQLKAYLQSAIKYTRFSDEDVAYLYDKYAIEAFNLHDRGYISHIHPLELWLVNYLQQHPDASLAVVLEAGKAVRQEVYAWLLQSKHKYSMDNRIQTLLEREVFSHIADEWRKLGYPFADMTPSFASAIGASGDRPASLAKLMGILVNDGVSYPVTKFEQFHFAAGTPFETLMTIKPPQGQRVMSPEVAAAASDALMGVVAQGTAVRLHNVYKDKAGKPLVVGGKTGTGDHVRRMFNARGGQIGAQVISRTATFVFFLGERHFGVITAYVAGAEAASFHFTSAVPVQVLKSLRPVLEPLLQGEVAAEANSSANFVVGCCRAAPEAAPATAWWEALLPPASQ